MRQETDVVRKTWEKSNLQGIERVGEFLPCDRRVVQLKALGQAGSGNTTVILVYVYESPL